MSAISTTVFIGENADKIEVLVAPDAALFYKKSGPGGATNATPDPDHNAGNGGRAHG